MDKDEQILRRHFLDLANTAYQRGIHLFSDFMKLNEQSIFLSMQSELPPIQSTLFGGFPDSERKMICFCGAFYPGDEEEISYPIDCLHIVPLNRKFSDTLTHRDFLGAVLNLGIDRRKLGDILINENEGYLFCASAISSFILDNLVKVKHTSINVSTIEYRDFNYKPKLKEITGTVSSVRLDSILSVAFHASRSSLAELIAGGKVYVNSKEVLSNSYSLKEQDVVSVRGYGKFLFMGTSNVTKKGRYSVKLLLYI